MLLLVVKPQVRFLSGHSVSWGLPGVLSAKGAPAERGGSGLISGGAAKREGSTESGGAAGVRNIALIKGCNWWTRIDWLDHEFEARKFKRKTHKFSDLLNGE